MSVLDNLKNKWTELSKREKYLGYATLIVALFIVGNEIITPISNGLAKNRLEIAKLQGEIKNLPLQIERFKILSQQKTNIENVYKNSTLTNGALSYLEQLVKTKSGISADEVFQIRPLPNKPFGGNFVQEQFRVEVKIPSMNNLVEFLKELKNPESPLLVTKLELTRSPKNDFLNTVIEVSNIKPGTKNEEPQF